MTANFDCEEILHHQKKSLQIILHQLQFEGICCSLLTVKEKFVLKCDNLDTMTNYNINADHSDEKNCLLDFLDQMRFEVRRIGKKSLRDRSLITFNN